MQTQRKRGRQTVTPSQSTWNETPPQRHDNYCRIHHRPFINTHPHS